MDYHPGATAPFPLDEGQLRSILATENGRKLLLLLQIPYCVKELVGCRRILLVGIHHKIVGIPGL